MATDRAHTLQLTGEMTLRQAGGLQEQLRDVIAAHDQIDVDCSGISEIDLSIVQLLVSACKSAEQVGKALSVRFSQASALDTVLRRAGFLSENGQPSAPEHGPWLNGHG